MSLFLFRNARFVTAAAARPFSSTSFVALKESDRHMPNQAEHNEKHKQDQLQRQEGKGHWKSELASDSEEALKAERHSSNESIEELQKKSAEQAQKKSG